MSEARKTPDMILTEQDRLNLVMICAPILLILVLLVTPKDAIGCGPTPPAKTRPKPRFSIIGMVSTPVDSTFTTGPPCLTSAPMGQFRHIAERRVSGSL